MSNFVGRVLSWAGCSNSGVDWALSAASHTVTGVAGLLEAFDGPPDIWRRDKMLSPNVAVCAFLVHVTPKLCLIDKASAKEQCDKQLCKQIMNAVLLSAQSSCNESERLQSKTFVLGPTSFFITCLRSPFEELCRGKNCSLVIKSHPFVGTYFVNKGKNMRSFETERAKNYS